MKTVKNYDKFSESYRLNENLLKKAWDKIVGFFKNKYNEHSWLYYAAFLKKTGKLPENKVLFITPDSMKIDLPTETEVEANSTSNKSDEPLLATESFKDNKIFISNTINEAKVELQHPDENMRNVDVDDLVESIIDVYDMNEHRIKKGDERTKMNALFIWGAPGIGKTDILKQVANKLNITVEVMLLSQWDAVDFKGMPKITNVGNTNNPNDERTIFRMPDIFPTSDGENGKGGILFFDEINQAVPSVLGAAMTLCLDGTIGNYKLPEHWIVIAAGNRPEDIGYGKVTRLSKPLSNRFAHINYAPTPGAWIKWALSREDINPDLIGFIQFMPEEFHNLDAESEGSQFPTPRAWHMASYHEFVKRGGDWSRSLPLQKILHIYQDQVGVGASAAFVDYLKLKEYYDEKDVAEVYKNGAKAKPLPKILNQSIAASNSIALFKKGQKISEKELKNVLDFAISLPTLEQKTTLISNFKSVHPYIKTDEPYKDIYMEFVKSWHKELKGLD